MRRETHPQHDVKELYVTWRVKRLAVVNEEKAGFLVYSSQLFNQHLDNNQKVRAALASPIGRLFIP